MPDYEPVTYGGWMAEVYDGWFGNPEDADEAVSFLSNQVRCVANVARRQDEGGALVVGRSFPTPNASREVMLPKLSGSRWTASSSRPRATLRSTSASTRRTP